jgi:signal transduction histidine kinase
MKKVSLLFLYAFAFVCLGLLAWGVAVAVRQPDAGIDWSSINGIINRVDPAGPAAEKLQAGDQILTIDKLPIHEARGLPGKIAGDQIEFTVLRAGKRVVVSVRMRSPTGFILWSRILVFILAFTFWLPSLAVLIFSKSDKTTLFFFLFFQVLSITLSAGEISANGPLWVSWLFSLCSWWVGPLGIYFHKDFLKLPSPKWFDWSVIPFFLAGLLTFIDLSRWFFGIENGALSLLHFLWIAITAMGMLLVLGLSFYSSKSGMRRNPATIVMGTGVGVLPFLLLSMLPEALTGNPLFPYEVTLFALIAIPISYSYSILRYRMIQLEPYVNRGFSFSFAIIFIAAVYGLVYRLVSVRFAELGPRWELALTIIMICSSYPIYRNFQKLVDRAFYGDWLNDIKVIEQINRALTSKGGTVEKLVVTLCEALQKTLQLENVRLCLADGKVITFGPHGQQTNSQYDAILVRQMLNSFQEEHRSDFGPVGAGFQLKGVPAAELRQILDNQYQAWIMIKGLSDHLGLILVGTRRGGGKFDSRDLDVLEVVVRQAKSAIENTLLMNELATRTVQIRQLNQQVLRAREEERKRISRNLHDQTIQSLVGLNFMFNDLRASLIYGDRSKISVLQDELHHILTDVRQVCADLRPPALDTMGLIPALHSYIDTAGGTFPLGISLTVKGDGVQELPDEIAICLFRVIQESVANAEKHARARYVTITLEFDDKFVLLRIHDDGIGFMPPISIASLTKEQHFGLAGLQELLEMVQGRIEIHSGPGEGCEIVASIPLNPPPSV